MRLFLGWFATIVTSALFAQDSVYTQQYLSKSTRFAWTTLGVDFLSLGGGTNTRLDQGNLVAGSFGRTTYPRLTIGGIHFWGHADFYVTFPLGSLALENQREPLTVAYRQGIETGARVYPWKLQPGKLRPFLGASRRLLSYRQSGNDAADGVAPYYQRFITPVQLGVTYASPRYLLSLSAYYQRKQEARYFVSPTQTGGVTFDPLSFNVSFSWYWDTDRAYRTPTATRNLNALYHVLQKENLLSAWYWGVGPSSALQISRSPYFEKNFPFLADDFTGGFAPDITFGRFFNKAELHVGVSYRTYADRVRGFDADIRMRRHSFMIEAFKNIFDWLGFVPYAGITGSLENLRTEVNGELFTETKPAVGFIFGWDIRVTKTGTNVLRTNLRYVPRLHAQVQGEHVMYDHLEFNFIQWVQYIGRKKAYRKYSANE